MKKIQSIQELPKWFNISNYNCLTELAEHELLNQVNCRLMLIQYQSLDLIDQKSAFSSIRDKSIWHQITTGVIIADLDKYNSDNNDYSWVKKFGLDDDSLSDLSLSRSPVVRGLNVAEVLPLSHDFKALDVYKSHPLNNEKIFPPDGTRELDFSFITQSYQSMFGKKAHIVINIEKYSNKEIMKNIELMLPEWRKELGISEPQKVFLSKQSVYKKVLEYQVIAFLDLWIWKLVNKVSIPHKISVIALYPNGEKGENELKQTVIPFVQKLYDSGIDGDDW